jgi:tetratricopeptide (TPR) repeat protein
MPEVTSVSEIGDFYAMGAWLFTETGRYEEAVAIADEGIAKIEGQAPNVEVHARAWKVLAFERLGRWDEAVGELARLRDLLGDVRDAPPYYASPAFAAVGAIHARRGERLESDLLADVLSRLSPHQGVRLHPEMIKMHLARAEIDAARTRVLPRTWRTMAGDTLEARGEVIAATGAWNEAPAALEEMRACAASSPWPALEAEIDRLAGQAALAAGDVERGLNLMAAASAAYGSLGCIWDRAITDLESAEAGGPEAATRAATAAAVFDQLRTPVYLARARTVGAS